MEHHLNIEPLEDKTDYNLLTWDIQLPPALKLHKGIQEKKKLEMGI